MKIGYKPGEVGEDMTRFPLVLLHCAGGPQRFTCQGSFHAASSE